MKADRTPGSLNALTYQSTVRPSGGHFGTSPALNEVRTITPIGM